MSHHKGKTGTESLRERLVREGFFLTTEDAERHIRAGEVRIGGEVADKPGMEVPPTAVVTVATLKEYVGRGAYKLQHALSTFDIAVKGRVCADVGSSTGGFTEVLLRHGAERVYAIDVGYGELDWKIRKDSRVVVMERTNARYLESLPEPVSIVSIDVSFISLSKILPAVKRWLSHPADIVALVKPQFEAARNEVESGGIVRDPLVHERVVAESVQVMTELGITFRQVEPSPILGGDGNKEFLVWGHFEA